MRMWRNWQTHKTKDLMKLLRAGSSPVIRTKLDPVEPIRFGWVFLFVGYYNDFKVRRFYA